jgi:hypothetical protein
LLPSWSPARSKCRWRNSNDFRRSGLFGYGFCLSLFRIQISSIRSWNRLSRFTWAGSTQAHTGQAISAQLLQVRFVQDFGSTRPALHHPIRSLTVWLPVQAGSFHSSPGSSRCRPVHHVSSPIQVTSGLVQIVSGPFRQAQSRFSSFQVGSSKLSPDSVHFSSVQAPFRSFPAWSNLLPLGSSLFVLVFVHFTHFMLVLLCFWASLLLLKHFVVDSTQLDYYY